MLDLLFTITNSWVITILSVIVIVFIYSLVAFLETIGKTIGYVENQSDFQRIQSVV